MQLQNFNQVPFVTVIAQNSAFIDLKQSAKCGQWFCYHTHHMGLISPIPSDRSETWVKIKNSKLYLSNGLKPDYGSRLSFTLKPCIKTISSSKRQ